MILPSLHPHGWPQNPCPTAAAQSQHVPHLMPTLMGSALPVKLHVGSYNVEPCIYKCTHADTQIGQDTCKDTYHPLFNNKNTCSAKRGSWYSLVGAYMQCVCVEQYISNRMKEWLYLCGTTCTCMSEVHLHLYT